MGRAPRHIFLILSLLRTNQTEIIVLLEKNDPRNTLVTFKSIIPLHPALFQDDDGMMTELKFFSFEVCLIVYMWLTLSHGLVEKQKPSFI